MHKVVHYVPTVNMWNVFEKIIQVWFSNHLRAKRRWMPMGQCWYHGRTHMNHTCLNFCLSLFKSETQFKCQRLAWNAFRVAVPKWWERLECQMSQRTLQMPHETTGNHKEMLRRVEGSLGLLWFFKVLAWSSIWCFSKRENNKIVVAHFTQCWLWLLLYIREKTKAASLHEKHDFVEVRCRLSTSHKYKHPGWAP